MSTPTERLRKMAIDARIQYGQDTIAGGEPPYPAWADDMLEVLERLAAIEQIPPHEVERVIKASLPDGRRLGINWDAVGRAAKGEADLKQISFNAAEVMAIYNHAPGLRPMFVPLSVYRQAQADGEQPAAIAEPDDMPPLDDRATYPASMIRRLIREDRARRAAPVAQEPVSVTEHWQDGDDSNMVSRVDTTAPVAANAEPETVGRTTKEAWWAGYRAGKGVPADMHRQAAVQAAMRCPRCGEGADVSISSAQMVTHRPDGAARDERDIASDPEGKLIHDPSEPLLAAPVAAQTQTSAKAEQLHPVQPLVIDEHGTLRFKKNAIVRYLLDNGPFDMNHLSVCGFSDEDREQFAQLIGYSLGGFGELSYVTDTTYDRAALSISGQQPAAQQDVQQPTPEEEEAWQALEREHLGDPEKRTGIYSPDVQIAAKARRLVDDAIKAGMVVRIDLVPRQPLAMGNLEMVVDVRPARRQS